MRTLVAVFLVAPPLVGLLCLDFALAQGLGGSSFGGSGACDYTGLNRNSGYLGTGADLTKPVSTPILDTVRESEAKWGKVSLSSNPFSGLSAGRKQRLWSAIKPLLGVAYQFGGASVKGMDCSAFSRMVYNRLGIGLSGASRNQAGLGRAASLADLQPGDLVFFAGKDPKTIDHVAVYMGEGKIAHASSSRGQTVVEDLAKYKRILVGARRIM